MIKKLLNLILLIAIFIAPMSVKSAPIPKSTVKESVIKHALELGVDPALALSIAKMESGFRHEAKSAHGAVGVFQLMPSTARRIGYNPWDLHQNVRGGLIYYRMMYSMFGSIELALAAYNAGPGTVKRCKGMPNYGETRRYVAKIMAEYNHQKKYPDPLISQVKNDRYNKKSVNVKPINNNKKHSSLDINKGETNDTKHNNNIADVINDKDDNENQLDAPIQLEL